MTAAARPTSRTPSRVTANGTTTARSAVVHAGRAAMQGSFAVLSRIDMQSVVRKDGPSAAVVVAAAVVVSRLPVLLCGAIAAWTIGTIPPPAAEAVWRVSANEVANLLARW